ncbi:Uncharacterised protein [Shigella flexneri]|nr:Uncharacterised protein [Shigella flexneri]
MNGHGGRFRLACQRFTQRQLKRRKTFIAEFLRELHDAGLTDSGFVGQLLRA